jgi:undecaprenyl-diphosphatase
MSLLQSILLGIVQGLTEFLPVSSSGHLAIAQNLFHIDTGNSILFDVLLHLGTLLAIFVVFWQCAVAWIVALVIRIIGLAIGIG